MDTKSTKEHNIDMDLYNNGHPHPQKSGGFKSKDLPRILSLPVDRGGCGWLRVRLILRYLQNAGLAETHIINDSETEADLDALFRSADVVLARNGTDLMMQAAKERYNNRIVFDHDDNTFGILPSNQHYKDHGTQDIWVPIEGEEEPRPLWVTGITKGFNRYRNLRRQFDLRYALEIADLVTSPTHKLSSFWANFNENAAVVYNCITEEFAPKGQVSKDKRKGDEFRIGWSGGVSHFGDIEVVAKALKKFMKKHKNVVLYMIGSNYPVLFKGMEDRIRTLPWVDFQAHLPRLRSLDLDLAFIPLADKEFNYYKSEIKFTEFSAIGVPSIVSNLPPYVLEDGSICKDNINCMTFDDDKEFSEKLEKLYSDSKLRERLGRRAKNWAYAERSLEKWAPIILNVWLGNESVREDS